MMLGKSDGTRHYEFCGVVEELPAAFAMRRDARRKFQFPENARLHVDEVSKTFNIPAKAVKILFLLCISGCREQDVVHLWAAMLLEYSNASIHTKNEITRTCVRDGGAHQGSADRLSTTRRRKDTWKTNSSRVKPHGRHH